MSNSVFTEHPSAEGDNGESKVDSNLIVFINKNGSVSVDQAALQDLLGTLLYITLHAFHIYIM